jgi:hypothetical protein
MPQLLIAVAVTATALGFGAAWKTQDWRYGAKETERVEQKLADIRLQAATTIRRADNAIEAQNQAQARAHHLRVAAAGSLDAIERLHNDTVSSLRAAAASQAACLERASALSAVLNELATAGGSLAAQADRHASDGTTLMAAWPK